MSQFETVVHHTVKDLGDANYIENNAPFAVENIEQAYLGYGYYFWDNHLELAHWWGESRYKSSEYVICEGELQVEDDLFFDLVGSRSDQIHFKDLLARVPELEGLSIGASIEVLKEMNSRPNKKGIFPFKVIRAIDNSTTSFNRDKEKISFAKKRTGFMTLNPQMIICLVEKNKVHLQSLKIIHPDKYLT